MLQNFLNEMGNVSRVLAGMNTNQSSHVQNALDTLVALSRELMGSVERNVEGNSKLVMLIDEIEKVALESELESRRLNGLLADGL
jgi:hypothetical protein